MGGTPNVAGMIADQDFQSLSPGDKRAALAKVTGDKSFSTLNDGETMQFISRFKPPPSTEQQTISQLPPAAAQAKQQLLAQQPGLTRGQGLYPQQLNAPGDQAAVQARSGLAAMTGTPDVSSVSPEQAKAGLGTGLLAGSAGVAPVATAISLLGAGAGGEVTGGISKATGASPEKQAMWRTAGELGGGLFGGEAGGEVSDFARAQVSKGISKLAGFPKAAEAATSEYQSQVAAQQEAVRQRAIGKRINVSRYQEAQQELGEANAAQQKQYQEDLAAAKEKIPAAPPGQQALWVDINKSIQASPAKIRVKLGAPDLSDAVSMPGRGLAAEDIHAVDLERLTPLEQNAKIAPKWNAAGQAIDAAAEQATTQGRTLNLYKLDEVVDKLQDPTARESLQDAITRVGKSLGISDWGKVTPTNALRLRRELFDYGANGEYVSRAISNEIRNTIPEMKGLDQHYTDLNAAMTTVRQNLQKFAVGKWKYPQMTPKLPEQPTPKEFSHPRYKTLAKVPETPQAPDLAALRKQLVGETAKKYAVKGALGLTGLGVAEEIGRRLAASQATPGPAKH